MELKDAQRQACQELGFVFENIFKRGRPSPEVLAAKEKMKSRIEELVSGVVPEPVVKVIQPVKTPEPAVIKETIVAPSKKRVNVPDAKPLHNCKLDVNVMTCSMATLAKVVPDFLKEESQVKKYNKLTIHEKIMVMAESDAKFDGYDLLMCLPKERRNRYIDRASRSFYALQKLVWGNFTEMNRRPSFLGDLRMTASENSTAMVPAYKGEMVKVNYNDRVIKGDTD